MNLISIVGHSGSGKTTFIEKLLHEFTRRGVRVATIKHTHHQVPLDTPGKDSWRHTQAGAAMSMLVTDDAVQLIASKVAQREPQQLAQRFLGDADLVLAEGFAHSPGAKIEVLRRACSATPRCTPADGLIAMISDVAEAHPQLPHFALDDVNGIVEFILRQANND